MLGRRMWMLMAVTLLAVLFGAAPVGATGGPGSPDAPTGVSATAGEGQAVVRFTPGSTNGYTVPEYSAACTPTAGGTTKYGRASASPITVPSLTPGTAYHC